MLRGQELGSEDWQKGYLCIEPVALAGRHWFCSARSGPGNHGDRKWKKRLYYTKSDAGANNAVPLSS